MTKRQLLSVRIVKFWLDLGLVLGTVAAVVLLLGWLVAPLMAAKSGEGYPVELHVALGAYPEGPWHSVLPLEPDPGSVVSITQPRVVDAAGELKFNAYNALMHFTVNSIRVIGFLVALWIVFLLRRIFQTVIDGEPFSSANAGRLRAIGVIIMVTGVVIPVAQYITARLVLDKVAVDGITLEAPLYPLVNFEFDVVLLGLMIVALSTVFMHGARIEQDQSLTV